MTNTSQVWTKKLKFRSMKINRNVIGWIQRDPCQNTLQLDSDPLCYHCETREQKPVTSYVAAEVGMITPWSHFFCPSRSREPYFMPLLFFPTLRWNSEGLVGTFNLMVNFVAGSWMSNVSEVKFSSLVPMVSHTEVRAPASPQIGCLMCPSYRWKVERSVTLCTETTTRESLHIKIYWWRNQGRLCELYLLIY